MAQDKSFFFCDTEKHRYPVWMEGKTIYTDPFCDMAGGNVPYLRFRSYPIPDELIHHGGISREELLAFLSSIKEPVPPEVIPEWVSIKYTFNVTLSQEDYLDFNINHIRNTDNGKKTILINRLLMPVIGALALMILYIANTEINELLFLAVVFGIVSVIRAIFAEKFYIRSMRKNIEKQVKTGKLLYTPNVTLCFDDKCITEITDKMEIKVSYSALEKVFITDKAYYFYIDPKRVMIFPYHNFKYLAEINDFTAWLKTKIENEKLIYTDN